MPQFLTKRELYQVSLMHKPIINLIKEYYKDKSIKILDIGAGTNVFLNISKKYEWDTIAFDINLDFIKRENGFKIVNGDVHNLPFKNDSFDVIVSRSSFCYFKNPLNSLKEIIRVLKPNNYFFIMDLEKQNIIMKNILFLLDMMIGGFRNKKRTGFYLNKVYSIDKVKKIINNLRNVYTNIDIELKLVY